jgi:hypothetical protein
MGSESPVVVLFDMLGNEMPVQNAIAIPATTPMILVGGSDGTNSRYFSVDTSGRQIIVGAAAAGSAPSGSPMYIAGKNSAGNVTAIISDFLGSPISSIGANTAVVQSNATIGASGSSIITTNDFGTQQISLVINITASPTGTTPTITFTIQEVDPGNGTTVFGNSATSTALNSISINTITLTSSTSNSIKVSWTVTGTTPSFTGVYATLVTKATPTTQPISGTVTAANASVSTVGAAPPTSATYVGASVTTAAPTYTTGQMDPLSLTTGGLLRIDGVYPVNATTPTTDIVFVGGAVTTASPTYTTGQLSALSLTTVGALRIDGSAVTQPVSGTVTANIGTTNGLALDTSVNGILVTQGSTTSGEKGPLIQGAVTTAAPTYTTAQTSPLSLTTAGALRIDGSAVTQPVSGTVTVQQATAANLNATVTGTVTANIGTTNGLALDTSVNGILVAQGSTTSGEKGPLIQGAVSALVPVYTNAQTSPLSLTTAGALRIDGSAVTQPVSGTVTANQGTANTLANAWSTKITDATNGPAAVKPASTAAVATDPALVVAISPNNSFTVSTNDTTGTGTLNAANATATVVLSGHNTAGMQLLAGTLIGTIVAEISVDGGTTWIGTFFDDPVTSNKVSSIVFGSANTATTRTIVGTGGASNARIRVSAFTSGTATCNLRSSQVTDPSELFGGAAGATLPPVIAQVGGSVTTAAPTYVTGTLNALSLTTAGAIRIDGSAVTQPVSGTVTANQGTANTLANAWSAKITDATNGPVAVKAASTTPVATDASLVVSLSPNSAGINISPIIPVVAGQIYGHRFGFSAGAGAPQPLNATTYTEQTTGAQRSLKSSSANDTSAGTGARTVKITYYDASMSGPNTETVTLNGTTAVTTTNTNICFIEEIIVVTVGSNLTNVGTISLYVNTLGTGTVIGSIGVGNRVTGVGDNRTYWAHHYVQSAKTMYISGMSTSFTGVTSGQTYGTFVNITSANAAEIAVTPPLGARQSFGDYPYRVAIAIAGPGRFRLYNSTTGGNEVDGSFEFLEQ